MASTRSSGLRAASLLCLAAAAQAFPHQSFKREEASFTRQGCFVGNVNGRILNSKDFASDSMTVEACASFCSQNKSKYFGIEYGRECYCGDTLTTEPVSDDDCSFACPGNPLQKCGAGNRLDLYINNLYAPRTPATLETPYLGCFVDEGARALPENLLGADDMTAEKCAAHCADFSYFGVEYGRECWCGNAPPIHSAPESACSMPCAGDDSQLCGAGGRINVWGSPLPSPEEVSDFEYAGCYTDKVDQRSLRGKKTVDSTMTLEKCATSCAGYSYFGVEFGVECYCGSALEASAEERPQAECSTRCGGNYDQVCGASYRINVFSNPECVDEPDNLESVGGFTYQSCWTDKVDLRALTDVVERSDNMTVQTCAAVCQGYNYFGVEYGRECFCGNVLQGQVAPESQCSYHCMGDATQLCGAPDRMNLYAAAAPAATSTAEPAPAATSSTVEDVPTSTMAQPPLPTYE
ncbi:putative fungistatic metabolite [Podospora australis]|uniref:Fungistatic metabolite n=1 Tax=Podospora australis TaxID=1536484 RepID=A0AAN6WJV7_9PEZI|nr:putative fungistatic metabolite [Podospora australis]